MDLLTSLLCDGGSTTTAPFTSLNDPALNSITQTMVDNYGGVVITLTGAGNAQTLPSPTITTSTHQFTVINNDTSTHTIQISGASDVYLAPGLRVTFVWDGSAWIASDASGLFYDDGTNIKMQINTRHFDTQSGYLRGAGIATTKATFGYVGDGYLTPADIFSIRSSSFTSSVFSADSNTFVTMTPYGNGGSVWIGENDNGVQSGMYIVGSTNDTDHTAEVVQITGCHNGGAVADAKPCISVGTNFVPKAMFLGNGHLGIKELSPLDVAHFKDTNPSQILESEEQTYSAGDKWVSYKGLAKTQSGSTLHCPAEIRIAHYGTADDQKGTVFVRANTGSEGLAPSEEYDILKPQRDIIYVESLNDLPAYDVGQGGIPLEAKTYQINVSQLLTPYPLIPPANEVCNIQGNIIVNVNPSGAPLFKNTEFEDGTLFLRQVVFANAGHANNTLFDISSDSTPPISGIVICNDVRVLYFNDLGNVEDVAFITSNFDLESVGGNLNFVDNWLISVDSCNTKNIQSVVKDVFNISGTLGGISFSNTNFYQKVTGQYLLNISSTAKIDSCVFTGLIPILLSNGGIFNPSGLNHENPQITVLANAYIKSSATKFEALITGNTNVTVVGTGENGVHFLPNVNTATVTSDKEERMRIDNDLSMHYFGLNEITIDSHGGIDVKTAAGVDKNIGVQFVKVYNESFLSTFNASTNKIEKLAHGLSNGDTVFVDNFLGTLPTALALKTPYYVVNAGTDDFQISATLGGGALSLSGGSGNLNFYSIANVFTVDAGTDVIIRTAHGLSNGDRVALRNVGSVGLVNNIIYYVINATANNFQVEKKSGSGAINITGAVPTNAYYRVCKMEGKVATIDVADVAKTITIRALSEIKTGDYGLLSTVNNTNTDDITITNAYIMLNK